jgi:hypothetical protein
MQCKGTVFSTHAMTAHMRVKVSSAHSWPRYKMELSAQPQVPADLHSPRKPQYPLNGGLGGPWSQVRCFCGKTFLLTYLLTPWGRILLEKLTGFHLVKKFPAFSHFKKEYNKNMFTRKVVFELSVLNRWGTRSLRYDVTHNSVLLTWVWSHDS